MAEMEKIAPEHGQPAPQRWPHPTAPQGTKKGLGERVETLDRVLKAKGIVPAQPRKSPATPLSPEHAPESRSNFWGELKEQAILAYESGLLPHSVDSRAKAITIALMGREFGLSPMQALCGIYVVNGMAALRGSLMLRLIYERVSGAQITVLTPPERAYQECEVEMTRPQGRPHLFRFTLEDARRAGFMSKPIWQQHTATMLRWAAIRTGARVVFADAIAGCYMEDEIAEGAHPPQTPLEEPRLPTPPAALSAPPGETAPKIEAPPILPTALAPSEKPVPKAKSSPAQSELSRVSEPVESVPQRVEVRSLPLFKPVTEKQIHRLYAIAHGKSWSRQDVGIWMEKWYKKRDPRELNRMEYDKLCNFLLSSPVKSGL